VRNGSEKLQKKGELVREAIDCGASSPFFWRAAFSAACQLTTVQFTAK